MRKINTITIVVSTLVVALLLAAYGLSVYASDASSPFSLTWSSNMMGQMMNSNTMSQNDNSNMQGMMNAQISSIDNATFSSEYGSPPSGVMVSSITNTIVITDRGNTTLPVEAAPLWYPRAGEYWLIYGLVNPTIQLKQGATVNFLFVNMDNETHLPAITTLAPPYPYMPMMSGMMSSSSSPRSSSYGGGIMGSGGGMMTNGQSTTGSRTSTTSWLGIGPMLPGVSSGQTISSNPVYSDSTVSITFNSKGSFWYLCVYPGHAQMGMYGEITVTQ